MSYQTQYTAILDYATTAYDFGAGGTATLNRTLAGATNIDVPKQVELAVEVISRTGSGKIRFDLVSENQTQYNAGVLFNIMVPTFITNSFESTGTLLVLLTTAATAVGLSPGRCVLEARVDDVAAGNKFMLKTAQEMLGPVHLRVSADAEATINFVASARVTAQQNYSSH